MVARLKIEILTLTLFCILAVLMQEPNVLGATQIWSEIRISGFVNKPLNFTYAELLSFPMVSEVATLECVDRSWKVTFNWTGVSLSYLLTLAQVKPEAYDVVFRAPDDYSSSITIEEAFKPTTILALKANGTLLSEISGREGGFRLVVPCKWGYKWVSDIEEIEVVDYDYRGTFESLGYSDQADIPDCEKSFGVIPNIKVEFNQTVHVGETVIFNASKSTDDGEIVSFEWDFGDGTSGNGAVVSHLYVKEGIYQVVLNVTDNDGLHNLATLTVTATAGKQRGYVPTVASVVLAMITGSLLLVLIILILKNRTNRDSLN